MADLTEAKFLRDVRNHRMTVIRADGVNRHVRFKQPDTTNMYFDLITWPGFLCYCGDMGTYVFNRLEDMFEFFRADRTHGLQDGRKLYINLGYWSEKVMAQDRDGVTEYSAAKFREQVMRWLEDAPKAVKEAAKEEVLAHADDGEYGALSAAHDFERDGHRLDDFYEANIREYTFRFHWCCFALAWGIKQYDDSRLDETADAK